MLLNALFLEPMRCFWSRHQAAARHSKSNHLTSKQKDEKASFGNDFGFIRLALLYD